MTETNEIKQGEKIKIGMPILQLTRLIYVKISGKILEATNEKLEKYITYANERMKTEVSVGDVIEHALKLLFERDTGFKEWLKEKKDSQESFDSDYF